MPEQVPPLVVTSNLELDPWDDLLRGQLEQHNPGGKLARILRVGVLPNATQSGRATVCLLVRMPDGTLVAAETTLRLWLTATAAIAASPVAQMEGM